MVVECLEVGPIQENCYLVVADRVAAVIDPGAEPERIVAAVQAKNVTVQYVFNTHGHWDHVGADDPVTETLGARLMLHPADRFLVEDAYHSSPFFDLAQFEAGKVPSEDLADGLQLPLGGETVRVIHTPGHTPGSVCFLIGDGLFTGDLLFAGSVGRTDLPGGSWQQLEASLRRVLELDPGMKIYPGHGPSSTIAQEAAHNPYLMPLAEGAG